MPLPNIEHSSVSGGVRGFLTKQRLFFIVAVALFVILWVTNWRGADFGPILLYSFAIGNLVMTAMNWLAPAFSQLRNPFKWLVYLALLFLVAIVSSAFALVITMAAYRTPFASFQELFWRNGRLGIVVVLIVGTIFQLYKETRATLERKNLELQHSLEMGETRSHLQDQELDKAREIQEGLLPKEIPQVTGLEVAGAWQPARMVGGDYFDVLKFSERKIGVCIGDVVGKGISAALFMANLQASFRAFALETVSPGALVGKLNVVFCNNMAPDKFVTFCYCTIDPVEKTLTYASAGHCSPILFRKSGEAISLKLGGTPLGIFPGHHYQDAIVQLASGDQLVLYSDGLTEAMNSEGQEFGEQKLIELGSRNVGMGASDLLEVIKKEASRFSGGSFQDDFTLVVVTVK